ncbi:MAG TPA: winged helix-turn-helix transcriptional regulator [Candidatus Acidoferrales bacterium]|nr:winged helix-turn-helix transcriptional regulator [Candidatus Acidoferrales bacterium]
MRARSYRQTCSLALALDLVGERWTLLIVRQLWTGPKRFKDLLADLPGIGTNLLAARLKRLEHEGIIQRRHLPPPAGSRPYELAERGWDLEPAILALGKWGFALLGKGSKDYAYRPSYVAAGMKVAFRPEAAEGVREAYEYTIDGEIYHARIQGGRCDVCQGPAEKPAFRLKAGAKTFLALARGELKIDKAIRAGQVEFEGDRKALARSRDLFRM